MTHHTYQLLYALLSLHLFKEAHLVLSALHKLGANGTKESLQGAEAKFDIFLNHLMQELVSSWESQTHSLQTMQ